VLILGRPLCRVDRDVDRVVSDPRNLRRFLASAFTNRFFFRRRQSGRAVTFSRAAETATQLIKFHWTHNPKRFSLKSLKRLKENLDFGFQRPILH
jgi:hypothetical protein